MISFGAYLKFEPFLFQYDMNEAIEFNDIVQYL